VGKTRTRTAPLGGAASRTPREHQRAVRECTSCSLYAGRTSAAVGDGPADARLVVVGVVPRRHEDLQGAALAGAPRNVLDAALSHAGIGDDEVRVTTLVRCRPPDDRAPAWEEIRACAGHLTAELDMVSPEVIVSLGPLTTSVLLGRPVPFERVAGYRLDIRDGVTLIPTHHPSDVVRGLPRAATAIRRDFAVARAVLDGRMATGAQALSELRSKLVAQG
jgi:uracil-DNA glycosylase